MFESPESCEGKTSCSLVVDRPTLAPQHRVQPPISEPSTHHRQLAQLLPQLVVRLADRRLIPARSPHHHQQPAGAPFADLHHRTRHCYRFSPSPRAYHFFDSTACNACLSSIRSATICFNFRFSSSNCFSRCVSLTPIPPYRS